MGWTRCCSQISTTGRTPLSWLQREATALTPRAILDEIEKLNYVRALGADASPRRTSSARRARARLKRRRENLWGSSPAGQPVEVGARPTPRQALDGREPSTRAPTPRLQPLWSGRAAHGRLL